MPISIAPSRYSLNFSQQEGLLAADIDLILPTQVSDSFLGELAKKLGINTDKVGQHPAPYPG